MLYTEEQLALIDTIRDFAINEIHPYIDEWEKAGMFPAHSLFKKLGSIDLLGIQNWGAGGFAKYGDFEKALAQAEKDSFKVLLSHDPSHYDSQVKNHDTKIDLTLSGHTHGMQFGIEIPGWLKFSPVQFRYPKWAGLYEENKRHLYVNRGFGYLAFPGRVGIWPEITMIELKKKQA